MTPEVHPRRLVIVIDGPAGAGKSTAAKQLAARLGYSYLDTGALYRAVAWKVLESDINGDDQEAIQNLLDCTDITVKLEKDLNGVVVLDSQELTTQLRSPEVTRLASSVAALPCVRQWLLPIQQGLGAKGGIVAEGRDMGTRVFPDANVKFFLDANLEVRAKRRHFENQASGQQSDPRRIQEQIEDRDARDRTREVDPLKPAHEAVVIDSTALTVDEVVETMMEHILARS